MADGVSAREDYPKIFVFCDDLRHDGKRVAVTNFRRTPDGGWDEEVSSRARKSGSSAGMMLLRDEPAAVGWALDPANESTETRVKFELACRKCGRAGSAAANPALLFAALDRFLEIRASEVALRYLREEMTRQK